MEQVNRFGEVYRFDVVAIDTENFAVTKAGEPVTLTPRAYDLLVYLVRNPDRVVEKQELFDAIWKETFVTDNALTRAVKEIRGSLGDSASAPRYIETVHKRGYRFIGEVVSDIKDSPGTNSFLNASEERGANTNPVRNGRVSRLIPYAIGFALVAAVGIAALYGLQNRTSIRSIAVLPFENDSGDPNLEYLSDGISETLIGSLSRLPDLSVKARSSVFRYKGGEMNLKAVGKELHVEALLVGRVVQQDDELILYLSLIDSVTENNLWSKQYSRKIGSLIALQKEIADDVARSLSGGFSSPDQSRIVRSYTENSEAYRLYLQGRYHVLSTRSQGAETGISYYRQAIALDPTYALAYAGLAEAAMGLAFRSELSANDVFPTAKIDAARALELDPQLADAYVALATVNIWYERDWDAARANIESALALAPDSPDATLNKGVLLFCTGQEAQGLAEMKRAAELDPSNLRNLVVQAQFMNFAGRSQEALSTAQVTLDLNPNFYLGHLMVSTAKLQLGDMTGAIAAAELSRARNPVDSLPLALESFVLFRSGKTDEGRAKLNELVKAADVRYVTPYNIALAYHGAGEKDLALRWLERAFEERDIRIIFLKDPKWDELRSNPRFQTIFRKVGLEVAEASLVSTYR